MTSDAPRRPWAAIGAVAAAVLVAAIVLVVLLRRGRATADPVAGPAPASGAAAPADPSTPAATPVARTAAPSLPAADPAAPAPAPSADDSVRDHRGDGPTVAMTRVPTMPPPSTRVRIDNAFANAVSDVVTPIALACANQIPAADRGAQPVIQVRVTLSITGGQMKVDGVDSEFRDVGGDLTAVKDCVKQRASSLAVDASGQPDVTAYPVIMPLRIPPP